MRQALSRSGLDIGRVAIASSRDITPTEAPYVLARQSWILERLCRLDDLELRFVRFALHRDLDVWLAMMREYAEELLNMDEVRQGRGAPIDYAAQSPFRELQAARTGGLVRPYLLGIGLAPASWKA